MMTVWGNSRTPEIRDGIARFVGDRIPGGSRGFGNCVCLGVIGRERLIAGVVFHNWNPEAQVIELSSAALSRRWLTRPVLWSMFDYAFNQIGCQMVVARVSEKNRDENGRGIQRIFTAYGFNETRIDRLGGRDTAELIYTLTDTDWRRNGFHQHEQEAREAA